MPLFYKKIPLSLIKERGTGDEVTLSYLIGIGGSPLTYPVAKKDGAQNP